VRDMALSAVTLPEDLRKYLTRATRGELEVRVLGVQEGTRSLYAVGRQMIYAAMSIAFGLGAMELHFHGEDSIARWPLGVAAVSMLAFLASSVIGRAKLR